MNEMIPIATGSIVGFLSWSFLIRTFLKRPAWKVKPTISMDYFEIGIIIRIKSQRNIHICSIVANATIDDDKTVLIHFIYYYFSEKWNHLIHTDKRFLIALSFWWYFLKSMKLNAFKIEWNFCFLFFRKNLSPPIVVKRYFDCCLLICFWIIIFIWALRCSPIRLNLSKWKSDLMNNVGYDFMISTIFCYDLFTTRPAWKSKPTSLLDDLESDEIIITMYLT